MSQKPYAYCDGDPVNKADPVVELLCQQQAYPLLGLLSAQSGVKQADL